MADVVINAPDFDIYSEDKVIPEQSGVAPVVDRVIGAAKQLPTSQAVNALAEPFFGVEEGFDASTHPELLEGIPAEYQADILDSYSMEEAVWNKEEVLSELENEEMIMSGGAISGTAIKLGTYFLDPTTYLGGAAEFKLAAGLVGKGNRLLRMSGTGAGTRS